MRRLIAFTRFIVSPRMERDRTRCCVKRCCSVTSAIVALIVRAPMRFLTTAETLALTNGAFRLRSRYSAATRGSCDRTSTDLVHWLGIYTNLLPATSQKFVDFDASNGGHRFYRAVPEPAVQVCLGCKRNYRSGWKQHGHRQLRFNFWPMEAPTSAPLETWQPMTRSRIPSASEMRKSTGEFLRVRMDRSRLARKFSR